MQNAAVVFKTRLGHAI